MKKIIILTIVFVSTVSCQAQLDTALTSTHGIYLATGITDSLLHFTAIKDSVWYEKHIDTIKTDFVIIVDSNNFVKKIRCDFIVHKYEELQHSGYRLWASSFYTNRNDTFLLNNNPVEVLLYRPKGEQTLIGNSR